MKHNYTKMQSAGNKFVFFDTFDQVLQLDPEQIRRIADRDTGMDCDQVLVLEPHPPDLVSRNAGQPKADVRCLVYNADGSAARQCGNGVCCAAVYLQFKGLVAAPTIHARIGDRVVSLKITGKNTARANLGVPCFDPRLIPAKFREQEPFYSVDVQGGRHRVSAVSVGNPHAVLRVEDVDQAPVAQLGPALQALDVFPDGVNVGFMQVLDRQAVRLRVFERGAGETLSCGSGACAAVVVGCTLGSLGDEVKVSMPGGALEVSWAGLDQPVSLEGEASIVSEGALQL